MERLHNFKPGQSVRVRANGPGVSLCSCRVSPGQVFYFAYSITEGRLKPEAVVMLKNKDFRGQVGLRFLLSDIEAAPEPEGPGTVTTEDLAKKSGVDWSTEARAISAEEAARHKLNATPEPEPVDSIAKDKVLELFLDAISAGFGPDQNDIFDRIEAIYFFSKGLKEL